LKKRVLLMISSMRGGGSEQQILLLLRHLNRERFEPYLYLLERTGDLLRDVPSDVPIYAFDDLPPSRGFYFPGKVFREQVRHLQRVVDEHSIDVIYDRTFHMTMIAGGIKQTVPRVSTIVSPPEQAFPLVESRFLWLKHRQLRKAYRASARIVAVSNLAAESAARFYGLSRSRIKTPRDERFTLVCVGRMTFEKGQRDLVEAVAMLANENVQPMCVWMIGDGPLRTELQQLATKCHPHEIKFLMRQSNPAPWIARADALVLPSHFEGMPNVVLEAFALSTPVIATRAGGTIELQRDEPTILWADPSNPTSLASAIHQFVADRSSAKQRADAATRLIRTHHDVQDAVRQIEEMLSDG
jgi:glycosyltransferase involved in cell wall biosynthesis